MFDTDMPDEVSGECIKHVLAREQQERAQPMRAGRQFVHMQKELSVWREGI